jgi:hypothetical protein
MGVWWRLRQWVYARPPVAATVAVALLLLVGVSGWESARLFSDDGVAQASDAGTRQVAAATTIRVKGEDGRVITHVVRRTRTVVTPGRTKTVVFNKPVTRVVPITVLVRKAAKTVANARTQTVVRNRTVLQTITDAKTIRQTVTLATQDVGPTQTRPEHAGATAKPRPTVTVTVTQTQTVTQPAVTVTVTTSKGH